MIKIFLEYSIREEGNPVKDETNKSFKSRSARLRTFHQHLHNTSVSSMTMSQKQNDLNMFLINISKIPIKKLKKDKAIFNKIKEFSILWDLFDSLNSKNK